MAVIQISAAGGNSNNTATWVGGVLPTTADSIQGVTGSGPLYVNAALSVAAIDMVSYANTLTLGAALNVRNFGAVPFTITFGSGMTIGASGAYNVAYLNLNGGSFSNAQLRTNGKVIPTLTATSNQSTTTLLDNCTVTNFWQYQGNVTRDLNGFQINVTNWIVTGDGGGSTGVIRGTTLIKMNGANCTWQHNNFQAGINQPVGNPIYIDTPGNFTITGGMAIRPYTVSGINSGIYYVQGTILGTKKIRVGSATIQNETTILDVNGMGTLTEVVISDTGSGAFTSTIRLNSNLNFTTLYIAAPSSEANYNVSRFALIFSGAGALAGGSIYTWPYNIYNNITAQPVTAPIIRLTPGPSHSVSGLYLLGGGTASGWTSTISSATGGTRATLNSTGNQAVFYTSFQDINASGGNTIYTFGGTAGNSLNIQPMTSYIPTSASTFVN